MGEGLIDAVDTATLMSEAPGLQWHQPVMGVEVLQALTPRPGAVVVDATLGTGGHSLLLVPRLLPDGRLVAIERDQDALELSRKRLADFEPQVTLIHEDYRRLPTILRDLGIPRIDGLLLDLGMSSLQVDRAERGFSFSKEGPLDMRMDREQEETAEALVNELTADELAQLLETLGEERFARRIARAIVRAREHHRITTTLQLARVVAEAVPPAARHGRLHPATRTFQALRMAVNDELGALGSLLGHLDAVLNPGGRAVILTFHSLEDRLVKHAFLEGARGHRWTVLTKKPIRPSPAEVARNPRARSAKLRAIEKR